MSIPKPILKAARPEGSVGRYKSSTNRVQLEKSDQSNPKILCIRDGSWCLASEAAVGGPVWGSSLSDDFLLLPARCRTSAMVKIWNKKSHNCTGECIIPSTKWSTAALVPLIGDKLTYVFFYSDMLFHLCHWNKCHFEVYTPSQEGLRLWNSSDREAV